MSKNKILHIEDSAELAKQITRAVKRRYGAQLEVELQDHEKSASNFIEGAESALDYVLLLIDLMVIYHPDDNMQRPSEVVRTGIFEAGYRLIQKVQDQPKWKEVPIIVFSSVETSAVIERLAELGIVGVEVIHKSESLNPLLDRIGELTNVGRILD